MEVQEVHFLMEDTLVWDVGEGWFVLFTVRVMSYPTPTPPRPSMAIRLRISAINLLDETHVCLFLSVHFGRGRVTLLRLSRYTIRVNDRHRDVGKTFFSGVNDGLQDK